MVVPADALLTALISSFKDDAVISSGVENALDEAKDNNRSEIILGR